MTKDIKKSIQKSSEEIKFIMQSNLAHIADKMIEQIMNKAKKSTPSTILNSTKGIRPKGISSYKSELLTGLAVVSSDSLDQARSEVPKASKVKLMEKEERLLLGEFDQLPNPIKKRIKNANDLLIGTQIADLEKTLFFQFGSSVGSDKPLKEVESDMKDKAESYILGNAINAGAAVVAANTVNEARSAFFMDDDVLEEITAFEFMNADPVSPICRDLDGTVFKKDDPDAFRYTPPLHYNAVLEGSLIKTDKGDIEIEKINVGDKVLTHTNEFHAVYETMSKFEDKEYFELELENGLKLSLTGEHPILTKNRGWIRTDEILLTDDIVCLEDIENK